MIGAPDMAFPRLNLASWYLNVLGGLFTLTAIVAGGVDTGWTFYAPLSTTSNLGNVTLAAIGIFIVRLLVDRLRPQLHRHHTHAPRQGHGVVADAPFRAGRSTRPA